jgi:hypothetical protein
MAPQLAADLARGGLLPSTKYVDVNGAAEILDVSASFLNKARMTGAGPHTLNSGLRSATMFARIRTSTSNSGEAA